MSRAHDMMPKIDTDKLLIGLYGDEGKEMVKRQQQERLERERHRYDGTEYEGMTWKEVQLREEVKMYEKDRAERQEVVDNFPGTYVDPMINCETEMIDLNKMLIECFEYGRECCKERGVDPWDTQGAGGFEIK